MRTTGRDEPCGGGAGLALAAGLLLAGCLPQGSPPTLVDHPISAAMRFDVVTPGPYSPASPRDDRTLASVMPGDLIRVTPFLIGPDGPLELEAVRPAWFYCRATRCFADVAQTEEYPPACASEAVGATSTCALGRAGSPVLQLGELTSLLDLFTDPPSVFMVAGVDGEDSPGCLDKLRRLADGESLRDCVLHIKPLPVGPLWRLMLVAAFRGLPDALPLTSITPEVQAAEADVHLEVPPLELAILGVDGALRERVVGSGDTVKVAPGETVQVISRLDELERQYYYQALLGDGGAIQQCATQEVFGASWLFTAEVDAEEAFPLVIWEVPEDAPATIHGYLLLGDGRAVVWGWLRFEVAGR